MLGEHRRADIAPSAHREHVIELIVCDCFSSELIQLGLAIVLVASNRLMYTHVSLGLPDNIAGILCATSTSFQLFIQAPDLIISFICPGYSFFWRERRWVVAIVRRSKLHSEALDL